MTPEQAIQEATKGNLRPVYLVLGEERYLADKVVHAIKEATMKGGIAGFNEDKFTAGESNVDAVLSASKMVPMMAKRRFVLARGLERWEKKGDSDDDDGGKGPAEGKRGVKDGSPLDALAEYAKAPASSTVLVLSATKLHAQRKIVTAAKKEDFLVNCEPVSRKALPTVVRQMAKERGHDIAPDVADHLAEIAGPELGYVADAIERLSLFVGEGKPFTEDAVVTMVMKVRPGSVWDLVDALTRRRLDKALAVLAEVVDSKDGGLPLLGLVASNVRKMVKMDSALRAGANVNEAAARAGIPPFKAQETAQTLKSLPRGTLPAWVRLLAEADRALKGSKRSPQAVLETMLISMCR
ncbi:DNA polymerase III subunit delta [Polyangium jinanense]|uniref:DNA-directed DNA polymerase n=1 Tax=Polyangium jinanense TaxID=2829994 RepID=A0A9X3X357_9BACT|nr:DNA polymerase III subunit delta [Polyangium jinanense]MDC3952887.1 DNA polymerase III subunit delta [Polyangium jinanense]MDC3980506.1 DNA polymerase III subunit delta [Polyangium jinanense]